LCSGAAASAISKSPNFFRPCGKISSGWGHVFRDISSISTGQMAEEDFSGLAQHIASRKVGIEKAHFFQICVE
jgi:hypothetical protein